MHRVNPHANESNGRGEKEKKEKKVSSKSLKHAYRAGVFGQEAAKIAIFTVFLRYYNANNYK